MSEIKRSKLAITTHSIPFDTISAGKYFILSNQKYFKALGLIQELYNLARPDECDEKESSKCKAKIKKILDSTIDYYTIKYTSPKIDIAEILNKSKIFLVCQDNKDNVLIQEIPYLYGHLTRREENRLDELDKRYASLFDCRKEDFTLHIAFSNEFPVTESHSLNNCLRRVFMENFITVSDGMWSVTNKECEFHYTFSKKKGYWYVKKIVGKTDDYGEVVTQEYKPNK